MAKKTIWVLGIDPGLSGALALVSSDGDLHVWDVPTFEVVRNRRRKREIDHAGLRDIILRASSIAVKIDVAYVEKVGAFPRNREGKSQGVTSMFSFGSTYGCMLQLVASHFVPREDVTPQKWKVYFKLRKGKDASRMKASELMPSFADQWPLVKHHGRAEAALIATYGLHQVKPKRRERRRLSRSGATVSMTSYTAIKPRRRLPS